jgi:hypothetical protein
VPCPETLVALGEAQAERWLYLGDVPLDDVGSTGDDALVRSFAEQAPCLVPLTHMVVLGSRDGDLLLLAADGSIRTWSVAWGAPYDDVVLAASLDQLIEEMVLRPQDLAERLPPPSPARTTVFVDGVEYCLSSSHWHREDAGDWRCVTSLSGDLAPHYHRRADGPHSAPLHGHVARACAPFTVDFLGDPAQPPRSLPVGRVRHHGRVVALVDSSETFIRHALGVGWTGRDGRSLSFDGWPLLP